MVTAMAKRRPVPDRWVPLRELSEEGKAFTATHPSLYMHIYCNFSGVHAHAYVDHLDAKGRLQRTEVARGTWKPARVTERLMVEWGQRALTRWLESHPDSPANAEPGAA